ncbi:lipid-A-disaccharide synthase [Salinarimonas ramus]|uniref:Lipid-A-disaccharide synthase n=1 Tax=Salinarimonas ramus TaxID=690164 RepID=A0A917V291_9HYPH|nr:lipid-A-disaccharide synthase [Salinarimonas ramus]GGK26381.1 lipid-A-disaccharide synthase [Salinarimonas ramus]
MSREAPLIYLIAGEESGDALGAGLMRAIRARVPGARFVGIGGRRMAGEGLDSLFPMAELSIMGILPVLARLPSLLRRIDETTKAVLAAEPDALVLIDSPDFTHRVARRARRKRPDLTVINYVSPTVWAWRPGRARKMRAYIDHVLALKPFEPAAHARLGGPPCTYVGHPLIEHTDELRPAPGERRPIGEGPLELLVLPGSRRSEVSRLMAPFGEAIGRLREALGGREIALTLPAVDHVLPLIEAGVRDWPIAPTIVHGEEAKRAAFRRAHAALAASGTVTLELALAAVPMVVAYKVSRLEEQLRWLLTVDTIVLANLVLGEKAIPEFVQADCRGDTLAAALAPLAADTPARRAQLDAFARIDAAMDLGGETPSEAAARVTLETMAK